MLRGTVIKSQIGILAAQVHADGCAGRAISVYTLQVSWAVESAPRKPPLLLRLHALPARQIAPLALGPPRSSMGRALLWVLLVLLFYLLSLFFLSSPWLVEILSTSSHSVACTPFWHLRFLVSALSLPPNTAGLTKIHTSRHHQVGTRHCLAFPLHAALHHHTICALPSGTVSLVETRAKAILFCLAPLVWSATPQPHFCLPRVRFLFCSVRCFVSTLFNSRCKSSIREAAFSRGTARIQPQAVHARHRYGKRKTT